ncbi:MAG: EscN/YscN/HrcN family type III secretion system ATPase [Candidatus Eremiobacteraeota bacterium]|nr:EscN/YscN/HrcN family type III secretion system ATPase [Candidatus Eremiobacteraeota bacterium]
MIAVAAGRVVRTMGETIVAAFPGACVGACVRIRRAAGPPLRGSVASVERGRAAIVPFGPATGIAVGDGVETDEEDRLVLGFAAVRRAVGAYGEPLDGCAPLRGLRYPVRPAPVSPLQRAPVSVPLCTGIRVLDGLLTLGRGARIGTFGPPGSGKSQLLEEIARGVVADAIVIGLVGERGREAQQWIARRDARTTIVCATSDRPARERVRAAEIAVAQAAALRSRGFHVLLVLDSLARYASAASDLRRTLGEAPGRGGYAAGVWDDVAGLLEIAGETAEGSITLVCSILTDGDDERDPLAVAARSYLDGHVLLSAELARAGRFPAIDVLASASRTMAAASGPEVVAAAAAVRQALALLAASEDFRAAGLAGEDPALTRAARCVGDLDAFRFGVQGTPIVQTLERLRDLAQRLRA